jgi:transposase-like protein
MLYAEGGSGPLAALPTAFPDVPVRRCWAHKICNVVIKVRKPDQAAIKVGLAPDHGDWSLISRAGGRWIVELERA